MWKGYYGKEPFDLRLTLFRLMGKLPLIAAVTLLGTMLFGGGYYVKNVVFAGEKTYTATSVYHVEYAVDNTEDIANVYINETSWNAYMQSQMFLDAVQGYLAGTDMAGTGAGELAAMLQALVLSDLRMPSTVVTADSPEKSIAIARAVEAAMTGELAEALSEIDSIAVIDPGSTAREVHPDVRPGRAFVLSAVLTCFFAVVVLLLKETGGDSIWLPGSIWKRYGIKTVGTPKSRELAENLRYLFAGENVAAQAGNKDIVVCGVQEEVDAEKVLQRLRETCPDCIDETWFAVCSPLREPQTVRRLREAGGILLAVKAGSHAGRMFERVLEYLAQQDCQVTAAILWDADERLIRRYDVLEPGVRKKKGMGKGA